MYPYKTFFSIVGEFEASIQSSWNESNQEDFQELNVGVNQHDTNSLTSITSMSSAQKLFADSELRSGSEEGKPVADSQEEEEIATRRSLEMSAAVAVVRTRGSNTEINHSGHKTEFDNNILRSHDSTMTESSQLRPALSNNTSSCLATIDYNNSQAMATLLIPVKLH